MITTVLAIWGAFLASVTFVWNIYREVKKTGCLRVHCFVGDMFPKGILTDGSDCLAWNITNIGKEPVVLTYVGAILKNGHNIMLSTHFSLPKTIQPGEYVMPFSKDLSILNNELKDLVARDSLGRTFKAPRRKIRKMIRKHKKTLLMVNVPANHFKEE